METKARSKKDGSAASRNRATSPIPKWELRAKVLLKVEMARKGLNFKLLSRRLEKLNITETPAQISRKVNRGKFSAAYLLACLEVLGVEKLNLADGSESMSTDATAANPTAPAGKT